MEMEPVEEDQSGFESKIEVQGLAHRVVVKSGEKHYVYTGFCDDTLTKWITKNPWDGVIRFSALHGTYLDARGCEILVYEDDEDEFGDW